MKKQILFTVLLDIAGGIVVGLMIAVCFLFEQEEVFENSRAFWAAIVRSIWQ